MFIDENFGDPDLDPRLTWSERPESMELTADGLAVGTAAGTDLWQRTHYGFQRSNAPALLATFDGDFRIETAVAFEPVHQYDQAGLLIWLSPSCWLKASIEFEPNAPSRLGSVVTNAAWSDWATQDVPASVRKARYRITRSAGDYVVEYSEDGGAWSQLRVAHLHEDDGEHPVRAGLYACSPSGKGFKPCFRFLRAELLGRRSEHP